MRRLALAVALGLVAAAAPSASAAPDDEFAFQQHVGTPLPLNLPLRDEQNRPVTLGSYFTGDPIVLVLEYLRCRTLCGVTLAGVVGALQQAASAAAYPVVAVSIDPRDQPADAAAAKDKILAPYPRADRSRLHILTGEAPVLQAVASVIGFPNRYDAELDQYVHPAGFVLVTPAGRISRYIEGVGTTATQLQAGLAEAAQGEIAPVTGGPLTRLLLLCHGEGLPIGRYSLPIEAAFLLVNIAGLATLIAVFAMIWRRRRT